MIKKLSELIELEISKQNLPVNLPGLYDPIAYTLNLGGKRIRPLLTLLSAQIFYPDASIAIKQALGIEIFHNFTLVHDDIMDNAPLRRGIKSVFKKWNVNTAILSGDVMFALATENISLCEPLILPQVLKTFLQASIKVCEGQQMDMEFEYINQVHLRQYLEMIELKTAYLIAGGLKIGAIMGGASPDNATKMFTYGLKIGTAFQLKDDYLDAFGDPEKFGKQVGGDILAGKKTYLYLKCVDKANEEDRKRLNEIYDAKKNREKKHIIEVKKLFSLYQIDIELKEEMLKLIQSSKEVLQKVDGDEETKKELINLTDRLTHREN